MVYIGTKPPSQNPIQADYWLSWFQAREVHVPESGQCAMLALYATISNFQGNTLKCTPETTAEANYHKKAIYVLMVSNLPADAALGLVDPGDMLDRLYPDSPRQPTKEASTALLCTHLLHERARSVDASVRRTHWADACVLRSYAQYLRQPLLVIDVKENGDGSMQIYSYEPIEVPRPQVSLATHMSADCVL